MATEDLAGVDATAQAELVLNGEASPVELVEAAIERIEAINPKLNAVITPMFEKAREAAAGELPDGPFRGVPTLLKDLMAHSAGARGKGATRFTSGTLRLMAEIGGVLTAMVTPFAEDRSVDEATARRLARHLIEHGSHGLVLGGTTGESPTLDDTEKVSLLRAIRDELGSEALIVCGTGSNDTRHSEQLSAAAADAGADAVLAVTPYYNKPNFTGIRAHYEAVAKAAGIPVLLYNIPSRVVVNLSPEQLAELAGIENVVGGQAGERRRAPAGRWPPRVGRKRWDLPADAGDGGAGGHPGRLPPRGAER